MKINSCNKSSLQVKLVLDKAWSNIIGSKLKSELIILEQIKIGQGKTTLFKAGKDI